LRLTLALLAALPLAILSTPIAAADAPNLPDLTSYAFAGGNPSAAGPMSVEAVADALKDYDVVLFGEWHDHPGNHLAEMTLFRTLQARVSKLALSLEMFERDVQPVLDDYMAGKMGEEALREKGRVWSNYAESYRPLVEYAKERKLPVLAANAPANIVRCVGQEGPEYLTKLASTRRGLAAAELHLDGGAYRDKFFRFLDEDGSHGANEKSVDAQGNPTPPALRSFAAQVTRDDTMAESITHFLQKNPGFKVMHVTGDFHVEGHLGTAERIAIRAPNLKIAVITPVEPDGARTGNGAEFVLLLRPVPALYANDAEKKAEEDKIRAMMGRARTTNACTS
jgi:uncharacterized iron-regulated protein